MARGLYESDFEETTIERLKQMGYDYLHASQILERTNLNEVVLQDRLEGFLRRAYPAIPSYQIPVLASQFMNPDGVTLVQRNESFHRMLTKGYEFSYEKGIEKFFHHVYPIDWSNPENNEFLVVNQLAIDGRMARRPDIIVYVNGLPMVIFELKSPYNENATIDDAYTQVTNYTSDISQLFNFIAFSVISDGVTTLHGMPGESIDYYAAWKSIDGRLVDNNIINSMKTMIEGMFPKDRLLAYIRNFIFFMRDQKGRVTKIGGKYHQFFGVQFAVQEAVRATRPEGDRKIGVIWHATGSGKSFSMLFFANIMIRNPEMGNPTIVIQVDRSDLDNQLFDTFVGGQGLVGVVHHAESTDDLRELLKNESGQIIFSTIEKFRLKGDDQNKEALHPVLSERRNLVVISDEAHRTQYAMEGFAGNLRTALPNASHIAFTGTPVDFDDRNTVELFGNLIHVYDMQQAVLDHATVPIYYESRLIPVDLTNAQLDEDFQELIQQADSESEQDRARLKWTALEMLVGTVPRLKRLAQDIVDHFSNVSSSQDKGMIVCMSRKICVALYNHLRTIPGCPPVEVVMTGDVSKDDATWRDKQPGSEYSHIKTKEEREAIKAKLCDPKDPLKLIIVRDMFLTGSDFPPMKYMYVDKPIKGHNLIQAISRVNRVFPGKEGGIVVDFIGISTSLKEATQKYTGGGGKGAPTFDIEAAVAIFEEHLETTRSFLPEGTEVIQWRSYDKIQRDDFIAELVNYLLGPSQEGFLTAQLKLMNAYKLVKHLKGVIPVANEVVLYDILSVQVRKYIQVTAPGARKGDIEKAVNRLVDDSLEAREVIDIFAVAGLERPDISILDEKFMSDLIEKKHVDLRLKLLKKLLEDEIMFKLKKTNPKQKSLKAALEKAISEYHNRVLTAAEVIRMMMEVRNGVDEELRSQDELGLSEEEMAFYHIIENMQEEAFSHAFMADLVHKVVAAMKKEFKIDWTNPHRADVLAKVNLAVKLVLMREKVNREQLRFLTNAIIEQAKEQYKDWPLTSA
ncbi:type I restriction enzyme R subunit [Paenibacillus castaneae]|uniref:type I restriction endonuclease subunit R n=1 Tax=Paenibacillus castaneae TaxID=474957 RepID=UPI00141A87DB|nr:type I restriction endonuclease subunit R [Paenibacillus castaneae]NIK80538.1 type I restriction enzyme R subunit [Paenibacillus castaneae]